MKKALVKLAYWPLGILVVAAMSAVAYALYLGGRYIYDTWGEPYLWYTFAALFLLFLSYHAGQLIRLELWLRKHRRERGW